ncbi:hypothetical protein PsorP6_008648 [Peronosclerospora sorghi]|uniref:Uncharacterized protein n=1 Tax=Peronosclerospora sorghi TaxID=230839 RepID=A0ACC0W8L2_9STRA|nr:hypothetical protein PsorP6_008648 [Peronosclerospora sorghi]
MQPSVEVAWALCSYWNGVEMPSLAGAWLRISRVCTWIRMGKKTWDSNMDDHFVLTGRGMRISGHCGGRIGSLLKSRASGR